MTRRPATIEYRKELSVKVLDVAHKLFSTNGFKSVKMDDIAAALGMSKRTLYELYPNKEELIYEAFRINIENTMKEFAEHVQGMTDTMDILAEFFRMRVDQMKEANPSVMLELEQYPRLKIYLEELKGRHREAAGRFYRRCQEEGYIRKDANLTLIGELHHLMCDGFLSSKRMLAYNHNDIMRTMISLFMRSICTMKGIVRMDEMLDEIYAAQQD